jgi:fatty-acyl-CoA synthase
MNPAEPSSGLDRNAANHDPLSPIQFLERSALVYPDKVAVRHGERAITYREFESRCRRFASALAQRGITRGDTVAVIAPNVPALLEAHYAVPALGAVLNALNYRLDARGIAFCLEHGQAKALIADSEFAPAVGEALRILGRNLPAIDIDDPLVAADARTRLGKLTYEELLAEGDPSYAWPGPRDEWDSMCLLYT